MTDVMNSDPTMPEAVVPDTLVPDTTVHKTKIKPESPLYNPTKET